MLDATLTGDRCACCGHSAESRTPILALCRELVAKGFDPDEPMTVFRDGVPAVTVRRIGSAAKLTVEEEGGGDGTPRFAKWKPWGVADVRALDAPGSAASELSE